MSLRFTATIVDPVTQKREDLISVGAGPEIYASQLYEHSVLREIGLKLLPEMAQERPNLEYSGADLGLLDAELVVLCEMAHIVSQQTGIDADNIKERATAMREVVNEAQRMGGSVDLW